MADKIGSNLVSHFVVVIVSNEDYSMGSVRTKLDEFGDIQEIEEHYAVKMGKSEPVKVSADCYVEVFALFNSFHHPILLAVGPVQDVRGRILGKLLAI